MRLGKLLNIIIAVLLFVILGFWGYYFYSRDNQGIGTQIDIGEGGLIFPPLDSNFTFETIYGKSIKVGAEDRRMVVDGFQGKIVFLKIFGWDCQYCKTEIPELVHLKQELWRLPFEIRWLLRVQERKKKRSPKGVIRMRYWV